MLESMRKKMNTNEHLSVTIFFRDILVQLHILSRTEASMNAFSISHHLQNQSFEYFLQGYSADYSQNNSSGKNE